MNHLHSVQFWKEIPELDIPNKQNQQTPDSKNIAMNEIWMESARWRAILICVVQHCVLRCGIGFFECDSVWHWLWETVRRFDWTGSVGLREQTGNPPFKERALATPIELRLIQKHGYSRDRVFECYGFWKIRTTRKTYRHNHCQHSGWTYSWY